MHNPDHLCGRNVTKKTIRIGMMVWVKTTRTECEFLPIDSTTDLVSYFIGVAIEDIPAGKHGIVQHGGFTEKEVIVLRGAANSSP
ncbi:MAG: hypothetical protein U9Q07_04150 [Planctomycetota bacterium]|nr:hypothetical protein [Planctomycetota bacterium]